MASPSNSQPPSAGPVCLALLKFSYATVPMDSVAPVPWTHISSKQNLFAVFETVRTRSLDGTIEERKRFKVLRDPEVMEELDLEVLAREALEAIAKAKDAHQHNRDQNVAIIVKVPVIAMKYPMAGGQVRRFQIRFASDEYYYDAMKMLSRAHVPTLEAGTFPQRPQTAASFASSTTPANHNAAGGQHDARPVSTAARLDISHNPAAHLVSPDRHASMDARPATTASSLMPPPSHFTNVAQPHTRSRALQLEESQPQTTIDLYTPRPSTLPTATSQHYSQLLPPKRELPFERPRASTSQASTSRILRSATKDPEELEPASRKPPSIANKTKKAPAPKRASTASQSAASKRKRGSAKATKKAAEEVEPAVEDSQAAPADADHVARSDTPVPSIEDLLTGHEHESKSDQQVSTKDIDTQALLARAEEVRTSGLNLLPGGDAAPTHKPTREYVSYDPAKQHFAGVHFPSIARVEVPSSSGAPAPFSPARPAPALLPCTPANQLINPSTPSAPLAQHTVDTAPEPLSEDTTTLFSEITDAYSVLMRHPAFANSDTNLTAWAALPAQQQKQAIETFVCSQYMDKTGGFEALVKVMAGTWQASIVWPEVYKNSI